MGDRVKFPSDWEIGDDGPDSSLFLLSPSLQGKDCEVSVYVPADDVDAHAKELQRRLNTWDDLAKACMKAYLALDGKVSIELWGAYRSLKDALRKAGVADA